MLMMIATTRTVHVRGTFSATLPLDDVPLPSNAGAALSVAAAECGGCLFSTGIGARPSRSVLEAASGTAGDGFISKRPAPISSRICEYAAISAAVASQP